MTKVIPLLTRCDDEAGNPGDVFIRYGLQYLISHVVKSPKFLLVDKFGPASIKARLDKIKKAGYLIYAGTPQFNNYDDWCLWYDWDLFKDYIIPHGIKFHSFAAGSGFPRIDMPPKEFSAYLRSSARTKLIVQSRMAATGIITCRDPHAQQFLADLGYDTPLLPCTAAWSWKHLGLRPTVTNKVAFVPPNPKMVNPVILGLQNHQEVGDWFLDFYNKLRTKLIAQKYKPVVICHGKEEMAWFKNKPETLYSQDPKELLGYYADLHGVIGTRLHGVVPAATMPGKRVVFIGIDTRQSAAEKLNLPLIKLDRNMLQDMLPTYENSLIDRASLLGSAEQIYTKLLSEILL